MSTVFFSITAILRFVIDLTTYRYKGNWNEWNDGDDGNDIPMHSEIHGKVFTITIDRFKVISRESINVASLDELEIPYPRLFLTDRYRKSITDKVDYFNMTEPTDQIMTTASNSRRQNK